MGKAKKVGLGVGIAIAAFFGIAIIAAALSPEKESSAPSLDTQTKKETPEDTFVQAQTSQTVSANDLTFKIANSTQDGRVITIIANVENYGQDIESVYEGDFRLIDGAKILYEDGRLIPPSSGKLPARGEIAPSAERDFKYVFVVPEGTQMADCQLVIVKEWSNPRYLDLV
jgi:hypothetical protein